MAVFKNSRYKGSYVFMDGENKDNGEERFYLSPFRENIQTTELEDLQITFQEGMRVDILAREYYGSEELDWVIMDANPKYLTPFQIKVGDIINIPNPQRVMNSE